MPPGQAWTHPTSLRATGIRTGPLSHEKSVQVEVAGIWEEHKGKGAQGFLWARAGTAGVSQAPRRCMSQCLNLTSPVTFFSFHAADPWSNQEPSGHGGHSLSLQRKQQATWPSAV